ncbi:MAG: UDP-N-acetylglucosamine 2-epimerase (non-hydrolyzing) [Candidatus Omnitrophica bacterium]|nr:UDP-N-acetylglucosamine 2-epimerase (non-hydrolyzing) [Candidatus Omnitrophota bacterium]
MKNKILIIIGTRPEIIKMAPVIRYCIKEKLPFEILHTGQHYSYNMDKIFFEELNLPQPDYKLEVGSGTDGQQTAKALNGIEKILIKKRPYIVLVQGDTNTTLAGALAASKLYIKIGHIEAGLRSYDRNMPEEINRVLTDHLSDYLFAPTENSKYNLLKEGIPEKRIVVTGNTIVDSIYQSLKISEQKMGKNLLKNYNIEQKKYFLLTLHRRENVDNKERLENILISMNVLKEKYKMRIIFPIHPRTLKNIKIFNLSNLFSCLDVIQPCGFLEFIQLERYAKVILTDSGGVQEESCILKVPCITLRENTERLETIEIGSNILAGWRKETILDSVEKMINKESNWGNPFGDGKASERICKIIYN